MKKIFAFVVSILLLCSGLSAQTPLQYGVQTTIFSKVLGVERTVLIGLPADYNKTNKTYPVIYLGDPDMEILHSITTVLPGQKITPEFIYVCVPHINRNYDLTISKDTNYPDGGGASQYLAFFEKELMPYIEKNYRTEPYRIMAGSSFGGLFTLYSLIHKPDLFDAYIASSPSCWYDNELILGQLKDFLSKGKPINKYLFITMGNETGMQIDKLVELLKVSAPASLQWKYVNYPEEIHGTMPYKSFYDGLKFIFKDWKSLAVNMNYTYNQGKFMLSMTRKPVGTVVYTTDGSEPNYYSNEYTSEIEITKNTIVKTRLMSKYRQLSPVDSAIFDVLSFEKPIKMPKNLKPGLNYSLFEGIWDKLPEFSTLNPVESGVADKVDLSHAKTEDNFALTFSGFFKAPNDGIYNFHLTSDDGSRLIFNQKTLINNDFNHDIQTKQGSVLLKAGFYPIQVLFYEAGGGESLNLEVDGPGIEKHAMDESMIFHLNGKTVKSK